MLCPVIWSNNAIKTLFLDNIGYWTGNYCTFLFLLYLPFRVLLLRCCRSLFRWHLSSSRHASCTSVICYQWLRWVKYISFYYSYLCTTTRMLFIRYFIIQSVICYQWLRTLFITLNTLPKCLKYSKWYQGFYWWAREHDAIVWATSLFSKNVRHVSLNNLLGILGVRVIWGRCSLSCCDKGGYWPWGRERYVQQPSSCA